MTLAPNLTVGRQATSNSDQRHSRHLPLPEEMMVLRPAPSGRVLTVSVSYDTIGPCAALTASPDCGLLIAAGVALDRGFRLEQNTSDNALCRTY